MTIEAAKQMICKCNGPTRWQKRMYLRAKGVAQRTARQALTLQELLAPKCLRFYMQDWSALVPSQDKDANDKENNELMTLVSRKTGISNAELRNFYPGLLDLKGQAVEGRIKERMSWAARRETQRLEDIAYSLLGIFGINMPVIYGEKERAFFRLQEEIIKIADDRSVFDWVGNASEFSSMLASHPRCFAHSSTAPPYTEFQIFKYYVGRPCLYLFTYDLFLVVWDWWFNIIWGT
jgi:hypothetical protein